MKRLYLSLTFLVMLAGNAIGQVVMTPNDTTRLYNDTLLLKVEPFRGNIQWQFSTDSINWTDIQNRTSDTLIFHTFDTVGIYRGKITEGSCSPIFTSTIKLDYAKPVVSTLSPDSIAPVTIQLLGEIKDNGGCQISNKGFYYSPTNNSPSANDNIVYSESDSSVFSAMLTDMQSNTTYYIRSFATNSKGTTKGEVVRITTGIELDSGVFTDARDGREYKWKKLGKQIWMVENLAYNIGTGCWAYANNENNVANYGRLYTWDAAQKACPEGWHVPSDDEMKQLEMFLGMTQTEANLTNTWRGEGVGTSMKKGGESGFEALLAGRRSSSGTFGYKGQMEYTWTSTAHGSNYGWRRCLHSGQSTVGRWNTFNKNYGFSVRCIKNQ